MNRDSEHIDEILLLRFLLGEVSKEEVQQVEEWLQLSTKNQKVLDDYETIWAEAGKLTPIPVAVDSKSAWKKISNRVDKFEDAKHNKSISLKTRINWYISSAAAIVIVLLGIYQLLINPSSRFRNIQIASVEEIIKDSLPDGSSIALNKNTSITYPKKFAKNERRVKLDGEAFFNVEANKEKPFIIETKTGFIQVLGTSFNVKAYENSELEVIVTEGLVKVFTVDVESNDTSSLLLKTGEKGKVSTKFKNPILVAENIPDEIFWLDYTLIFNDTDLKKVFELLENYYNIEIEVNNKKIHNCRLSTTFSNNSITDIIEVIIESFDLEYTKENDTYTITGDGCPDKNI